MYSYVSEERAAIVNLPSIVAKLFGYDVDFIAWAFLGGIRWICVRVWVFANLCLYEAHKIYVFDRTLALLLTKGYYLVFPHLGSQIETIKVGYSEVTIGFCHYLGVHVEELLPILRSVPATYEIARNQYFIIADLAHHRCAEKLHFLALKYFPMLFPRLVRSQIVQDSEDWHSTEAEAVELLAHGAARFEVENVGALKAQRRDMEPRILRNMIRASLILINIFLGVVVLHQKDYLVGVIGEVKSSA